MNRRNFLQRLAVGTAAIAITPVAPNKPKEEKTESADKCLYDPGKIKSIWVRV